MLYRIVKMQFIPEKVDEFLKLFHDNHSKIRAFEGCGQLKLLRVNNEGSVFFTFSLWESEEALEKYRSSELFKSTWKKTKVLFSDKPIAWSTEASYEV